MGPDLFALLELVRDVDPAVFAPQPPGVVHPSVLQTLNQRQQGGKGE